MAIYMVYKNKREKNWKANFTIINQIEKLRTEYQCYNTFDWQLDTNSPHNELEGFCYAMGVLTFLALLNSLSTMLEVGGVQFN